jgi:hypothetical protein
MQVIESISSRTTRVGELFTATVVTVSLTVNYCGDETIQDDPNQVIYDLQDAGYIIEINRPYGSPTTSGDPPVPSTLTPITGYSASNQACPGGDPAPPVEGFEVTSYNVRRDPASVGVFRVEITNQMVEYQLYNHAITTISPGQRAVKAWRVRPDVPTLAEDTTGGTDNGYTEDLLPQYADNTLNGGDIEGQKVDVNLQPISIPIWNTTYRLSFVARRPYYASAGAVSQTVDFNYQYWTEGPGSYMAGKRLQTSNGNLTPIGDVFRAVGVGVTITPIAGTWVRVDIEFTRDEWDHLEQMPFSVQGMQPQDVERFPGTGFKMLSSSKVGFMDTNPEIVEMDMQYLPCNALAIFQAQLGTF